MTDRDHFAAAALTGLLYPDVDDEFAMPYIVGRAYLWADAMLCERAKTNHDAAPAARASEATASPARACVRSDAGTGDTPKPISGCVSDRSKPINGPDPDSRVWETPVHTPAPHATPGDGSVPREGTQEPVAWGVASHFRVLATSISRMDAVDMQSDYPYHTEIVPLYRQAPDFAPPPPDNAAKAPDNAEPVAWAVCTPSDGHWSPCYFHEPHAQRCANAIVGEKNVVPLYRSPTLTDAEAETLRELRDEAAQYADEIGLCASEVRGRQRIIDGLLARLGGER